MVNVELPSCQSGDVDESSDAGCLYRDRGDVRSMSINQEIHGVWTPRSDNVCHVRKTPTLPDF